MIFPILLIFFLAVLLGVSIPGDYDGFREFLRKKAIEERVYVKYHNNLSELRNSWNIKNKKLKVTEQLLGSYITTDREMTLDEKKFHKMPRIELTRKLPVFMVSKSVFNALVFAHELGHHHAIKYKNDHSEKGADKVALELFKEFFPWYKQVFYFPLTTYIHFKIITNM